MISTAITILFGHAVSMLVTFTAYKLKFRVTLAHWIVNLVLGAIGAVAANELLFKQFGPVIFGQTILPNACRFNCSSRCWKLDSQSLTN